MVVWKYLEWSGFKKLMKALSIGMHEHTAKQVTFSKRKVTSSRKAKDVKRTDVRTFLVKQKLSVFCSLSVYKGC